VTWDGPGGAGTQEPRHGGRTRSPAFEKSPCGAVYSGIFDLAESNEAEASIPSRVAKLRLVDAKGCPGANPSDQAIKLLTRAEVSIPLNARGAAHIAVDLALGGPARRSPRRPYREPFPPLT
jgi:hypothetical protein